MNERDSSIVVAWLEGKPQREIAQQVGLSRQQVWNIISRVMSYYRHPATIERERRAARR